MTFRNNTIVSHAAASYIMIIIRQIKRGDRSHNESQSGKFNSGLLRRLTRLRIGTTMEDEEKKEEEKEERSYFRISLMLLAASEGARGELYVSS